MVLRIGTSRARAPPTSTPTSLTHQEVACLKTALALVVVKRRLETRRRPSPLPDQDNDDDDGNNNSSMEYELETNASSITNQLCPWMPLLGSKLTTATAGATSSTSTAWMKHRSSIPSTGTTNGNGNGSNSNSAADWVHMDHFMGLALQRAALTFEATATQQNVNRPHNSNHNDKGPLTALTTHLAHQLVRIHNNSNNSRSTTVSGVDAISDWIRSTFLNDSDPTTQSNGEAQSSSLHLQTACIVWHGMLTAQPVELPVVLIPVLVSILQQALDKSTSSLPPSATTMVTNDNDHALYLQLFEHALHQAPTATVEAILEELALTPAQYCLPVALVDLAANYEWKRRRNNKNSGSSTATNHATNSHTTAGGALLLRYGMSSILQQTMLAHHNSARGIHASREI
jgi:hypothetical protein